jgi:hypothetical protein
MLKKKGITYAAVFTDPDEAGELMGEKIGAQLTAAGIECELFWDDEGKDPGDMDQTDANAFMKDVLGLLPTSPRGI